MLSGAAQEAAAAQAARRVPTTALVLAAALLQRTTTLLVMLWCLGRSRFVDSLMAYDAGWYLQVVEHGYHLAGEGGFERSNLAFFPLYPATAKVVSLAPGVSVPAAMLVLAFTGSVLAAVPIFAVGRHLYSTRVGVVLALLWGASPQSFVLVMGYPEGWFTAATAWGLLFVLQRRPVAAAAAVAVAGLLRPAAVPLVGLIMVWALWQWWRDPARGARWVVAALTAPLGLAAFLAFVARKTGNLLGYFTIQEEWNLQTGAPWAFWQQVVHRLTVADGHLVSGDIYVPIIMGYVALLVLLLGMVRRDGHFWIVLHALLGSVMVLSRETYFESESRQFLSLFPLLLPLATIQTSRWAWGAAILGMTMATAWFGGEFLAAREYSP